MKNNNRKNTLKINGKLFRLFVEENKQKQSGTSLCLAGGFVCFFVFLSSLYAEIKTLSLFCKFFQV